MSDDVLTRNSDEELALRVVESTGDKATDKNDVYTRDDSGNLAVRVVGGTGGGSSGGDVSSVNGKKGNVVLTGNDINATLTGTGEPVTATITEHLQTLKNDETELGNQVSGIESKIPAKATPQNPLVTQEDIQGISSDVIHDDTLNGAGTAESPLSVVKPAITLTTFEA